MKMAKNSLIIRLSMCRLFELIWVDLKYKGWNKGFWKERLWLGNGWIGGGFLKIDLVLLEIR